MNPILIVIVMKIILKKVNMKSMKVKRVMNMMNMMNMNMKRVMNMTNMVSILITLMNTQ